jgi:Zn-dependent protease
MDDQLAEQIQSLCVRFIPFFMAVIFHEYAHGLAAFFYGDKTAQQEGRLTLNPLVHVDIMGTLVLPIVSMLSGVSVLFGWAKPMPVNPHQFRHYRKGVFFVAAAGPLMNVFLAVCSAFFCVGLDRFCPHHFYLFEPLFLMANVSILFNYSLALFNLLPIPPLDGAKMIDSCLSVKNSIAFNAFGQYSFFIFLFLMFSGAFSLLFRPLLFLTQSTLQFAHHLISL